MICEKCGREYEGEYCPYCQQPSNPEQQAQVDPSAQQPEEHRGVYSDTVQTPPSWNSNPSGPTQNGGWNSPAFSPENRPKCPICGYPIEGNFCQRCGTANPYAHPQPSEPQPYWNGQVRQPGAVPGAGFQAPLYSNGPAPFTQNYQEQFHAGKFPKKRSSWVVLLVIFGLLVQVILPLIGSISLVASGRWRTYYEEYYNGLFDQPYYEDFYDDSYDDNYDDFWDVPDEDDNQDEDGYREYVSSDAKDTGESVIPSGVSLNEFRQLKQGMTYAEVSGIIGGDAFAQEEETESDTQIVLLWRGEYNIAAVVRITFEDSEAIRIEQQGLDQVQEE